MAWLGYAGERRMKGTPCPTLFARPCGRRPRLVLAAPPPPRGESIYAALFLAAVVIFAPVGASAQGGQLFSCWSVESAQVSRDMDAYLRLSDGRRPAQFFVDAHVPLPRYTDDTADNPPAPLPPLPPAPHLPDMPSMMFLEGLFPRMRDEDAMAHTARLEMLSRAEIESAHKLAHREAVALPYRQQAASTIQRYRAGNEAHTHDERIEEFKANYARRHEEVLDQGFVGATANSPPYLVPIGINCSPGDVAKTYLATGVTVVLVSFIANQAARAIFGRGTPTIYSALHRRGFDYDFQLDESGNAYAGIRWEFRW